MQQIWRRRSVAAVVLLVAAATAAVLVVVLCVAGLVGLDAAVEPGQQSATTDGQSRRTGNLRENTRQRRRRTQTTDEASSGGVLIHLASNCASCIGISAITGAVRPGSSLIEVDCDDASTNIQKLWTFTNSGNWCLLSDPELCVFYNPSDLLKLLPGPVPSQNQYFFHEESGEITLFTRPDQCLVIEDGRSIDLGRCSLYTDARKDWNLTSAGSYQCDQSAITPLPSSAPNTAAVPTSSPSKAPVAASVVSPVPTSRPSISPAVTPATLAPTSTAATNDADTSSAPTPGPATSTGPTSTSSAPTTTTASPTVAPDSTAETPQNTTTVAPTSSPTTGTNTESLPNSTSAPSAAVAANTNTTVAPTPSPTTTTGNVTENKNTTASSPSLKPTLSPTAADGEQLETDSIFNNETHSSVNDTSSSTDNSTSMVNDTAADGNTGNETASDSLDTDSIFTNETLISDIVDPDSILSDILSDILDPDSIFTNETQVNDTISMNGNNSTINETASDGNNATNATTSDLPTEVASNATEAMNSTAGNNVTVNLPTNSSAALDVTSFVNTSVPSSVPSLHPSSQPSALNSSQPLLQSSDVPSAAPSVDDGISLTEVSYSLSVRYATNNLTAEDVLFLVNSSAFDLLQEVAENKTTDMHRLTAEDGMDIGLKSTIASGNTSTTAVSCQSPSDDPLMTSCDTINIMVEATHQDTASSGEVRYVLLALTQDLIDRLQLVSLEASSLGPRVASNTNRLVVDGVANDSPPTKEAIAVYETAFRTILGSERVREEALGMDVLHLEVTSATVHAIDSNSTSNTANGTADNIFHRQKGHDDEVPGYEAEQMARRHLQADQTAVTFATLILGEYESPTGIDADLDEVIANNADDLLSELKRTGGQYFKNVTSIYPATDVPTAAPTKPPSPNAQSLAKGSDGGSDALSTGAIVGIAVGSVSAVLIAALAFLVVRRRRSNGKQLMSNDEFDALQREKRIKLETRLSSRRNNGYVTAVDTIDAFSEGSQKGNDDYYDNDRHGWNEVEDADGGSSPPTRTDLGDRWAAFEQDETLEQQTAQANSNAVLMNLKNAVKRAWRGGDEEQQSVADSNSSFGGAAVAEADESDEDYIRKIQHMYVRGEISKGEFVTLKESHLRHQKMQQDEEEMQQAEAPVPDDESLFSTNPEIDRMYREGEITEAEYRQMLQTHDRLKQAQSDDEPKIEGMDNEYDDHQQADPAPRDDQSLFSSIPEAERLYKQGDITEAEYKQIKDTHNRLRRSQVEDADMYAGLLDGVSDDDSGGDYNDTLGNNYDEAPLQQEPPDDETLFSNNEEMDRLYHEGKISEDEWKQMKRTHARLKQEQQRGSGSEDMDVYNDDLYNNEYVDDMDDVEEEEEEEEEADWEERQRKRAEEEAAAEQALIEEERRRAEEEEEVRRRVQEQFRETEQRFRQARMEDEWGKTEERSEDAYHEEKNGSQAGAFEERSFGDRGEEMSGASRASSATSGYQTEEYDNFDEEQSLFTTSNEIEKMYQEGKITQEEYRQIQASHGRLKQVQEEDEVGDDNQFDEEQSLFTTSHEIERLYEEGAITEAEKRQMLENHGRLKQVQEMEEEPDELERPNDEESVFSASKEIERLYAEGAITKEEMREMQLNHNRLKKTQKIEEIERMYAAGEISEEDYRLLQDSYERLQNQGEEGREQGHNSLPPPGTERETSTVSRHRDAPELTPDDTSVFTSNSEVEQMYRDGMLEEEEYRQMRQTHSRLRKLQRGEMSYRAAKNAPALW